MLAGVALGLRKTKTYLYANLGSLSLSMFDSISPATLRRPTISTVMHTILYPNPCLN